MSFIMIPIGDINRTTGV